ncbi:MAG: hypothetical protein QXX30_00950 [Candidatus Aenigmatarchaeota archaeon]
MKNSIKFGIEIEIFCKKYDRSIFNEPGFKKEYYDFHVEFNDFIYEINEASEIKKSISSIRDWLLRKTKKFKQFAKGDFNLDSIPVATGKNTIVFNGVHLHFSFENKNMNNLLEKNFNNLTNYLLDIHIKNRPLDPRFIFSHHIWGGMKISKHSYKNKSRYLPLNGTSINTIEIRYLNYNDLLDVDYLTYLLEGLMEISSKRKIRYSGEDHLSTLLSIPLDINYDNVVKAINICNENNFNLDFTSSIKEDIEFEVRKYDEEYDEEYYETEYGDRIEIATEKYNININKINSDLEEIVVYMLPSKKDPVKELELIAQTSRINTNEEISLFHYSTL